jgi:hypothetical protein
MAQLRILFLRKVVYFLMKVQRFDGHSKGFTHLGVFFSWDEVHIDLSKDSFTCPDLDLKSLYPIVALEDKT